MGTTDLQSATNLLNRVLDDIRAESRAVSTASLAIIVAVLSLLASCLISLVAVVFAIYSNARVSTLEKENVETVDQLAITQIYLQQLPDRLRKGGIPDDLAPSMEVDELYQEFLEYKKQKEEN